jgi:hypothetical protein
LVPPAVPAPAMFMLFMFSLGLRNVAYNTLTSKVPKPLERARFMSMQSAVQHLASAGGAFLSSRMLTELPDHTLAGMGHVAAVTIVLSLVLQLIVWAVERSVRVRARAAAA